MEIIKRDNKLVVKVPLKDKRYSGEETDNIIAVYENDDCNGLSYRIDMSYKGKLDQFTDYFLRTDLPLKKFERLVERLDIAIVFLDDVSSNYINAKTK